MSGQRRLLVAILIAAAASMALAEDANVDPLVVERARHGEYSEKDTLELRARVSDLQSVERVVLFIEGELDDDFRRLDMQRTNDGEWAAVVLPWPERGNRMAYYVEALDHAGLVVANAGSANVPYAAHLLPAPRAGAPALLPTASTISLLSFGILLVLSGYVWAASRKAARLESRMRDWELEHSMLEPLRELSRLQRDAQQEIRAQQLVTEQVECNENDIFWYGLLAPLRSMEKRERENAYLEIASRAHHHPTQGKLFFDRNVVAREFERTEYMVLGHLEERRRQLTGLLERTEAAHPEPATSPVDPAPRVAEPPTQRDNSPQSIAEEIFWFHVLEPVRKMRATQQQEALRELSTRPHQHPIEGNRLFTHERLAQEFAWVAEANVTDLRIRWKEATLSLLERAEAGLPPRDQPEIIDASHGAARQEIVQVAEAEVLAELDASLTEQPTPEDVEPLDTLLDPEDETVVRPGS